MIFNFQPPYIQSAVLVAAKFGYLRKEVFWNFISAPTRSAKYRAWNILMRTGYLENYNRPVIADDVFKLTKTGKRVLRNAGISPVGTAHPLHMEHDDIAVNFLMAGVKSGYFGEEWMSEKVLKQFDKIDRAIMIGSQIEKLPDLLFDINFDGSKITCALEVERTRKEKSRHNRLIWAYQKATKIDLVLIAYNDASVKRDLLQSANACRYPQDLRPLAFCKIKNMQANWTEFPIEIGGKEISFSFYVEQVRKQFLIHKRQVPDAGRTISPTLTPGVLNEADASCLENSS